MLIGFFLRRIVTLTLCAGAFWLGMKTDRVLSAPVVPCEEPANGN
ncbi:hypothetical protein [Defluviimonas sp. WL0075]|uniref:Uncharacterized protein n=1 Tax=Albidovulum sediminicola TaxID=2984331 RepID=A0ABT2YYU1_9RHOB|nr:hypothetical protein [Defluviimonas sp. WL0075]MCV2864027.1 hypothetical protein [Defluviimonas sp. WL0075]